MSFEPKTQAFNSSISAVTIGTGDKAVALGGINVLPFYAFDAPITNAPKIGVEITDHGMAAVSAGRSCRNSMPAAQTVADYGKARGDDARRDRSSASTSKAADPNGDQPLRRGVRLRSPRPLPMQRDHAPRRHGLQEHREGCASSSRRSPRPCRARTSSFFSAREENYKSVGASAGLAYGQKVGAESAVDINLAKQLNVLMTQLGRRRRRPSS